MSDVLDVAAPKTPPISVSSASTELNLTGSWKYIRPVYRDGTGPCRVACPTGVDIPGYMALLREGRIAEAAEILLRDNPIPAITGRVCDHPCEGVCNRAHFDGAVAVHAVERMIGDAILAQETPRPVAVRYEEKIAIIGTGPAGLACAYHLVNNGYRVEMFEQDEQPGGMLRAGIPEYRLPRNVLDAQIDRLRAMGVVIHCSTRLGDDLRWSELTDEFASVFVATGAHISKASGFDTPAAHSIWSGLHFLRLINRGERPTVGAHVIVVGGGNTAMDCARTALRLGAVVTVAYRRTRTEMPALPDEITDAEREGVRFLYLASPIGVSADADKLKVMFEPMTLGEPDASGRRRPVRDDSPPFEIDCDTLITAIGEDPELGTLPEGLEPVTDEWGASSMPGIFMGGDLTTTSRTVAHALGAGKRAADGIHRYLSALRGARVPESRYVPTDDDVVQPEQINTNHFAHAPRHADRHSQHVLPFAEVNAGLTHEMALAEAKRCFECGTCNSCELCLIYCADAAIVRGNGNERFRVLLDYCKGCGVCAAECPRGAIVMTREGL